MWHYSIPDPSCASVGPSAVNAERPDVGYSLVAVDFLDSRAVQTALTRVSSQLAASVLKPLPQVVHSLSAVQAALRQMSQARHVGKIVVRTPVSTHCSSAGTAGSVLVTGGLGSLGSLTAAWLAQNSLLRIHAAGRTGYSAGATHLSALMHGGFGGLLTTSTADAAASEDAGLLLAASWGVVGLVHASGVLADATLRSQTLAGIRAALAPKTAALRRLGGAYGLQPGAFQVLFSSIAALMGSPGQANYSAANAMLDSMAQTANAQVGRQSAEQLLPALADVLKGEGGSVYSSTDTP